MLYKLGRPGKGFQPYGIDSHFLSHIYIYDNLYFMEDIRLVLTFTTGQNEKSH